MSITITITMAIESGCFSQILKCHHQFKDLKKKSSITQTKLLKNNIVYHNCLLVVVSSICK